MKKIGFLINPIAGMGGRVGLKGTDGVVDKALELGAKPVSPEKAIKTLAMVRNILHASGENIPVKWLTCSGRMGEKSIQAAGFGQDEYDVSYTCEEPTQAHDTKMACKAFLESKVDLIFFCGGDGTARDIFEMVDAKVPILGIPSGVKMHSGVFGVNLESTAELVADFLSDTASPNDAEILDVDEERYREGEWKIKLFGVARTPYEANFVQGGKMIIEAIDEDEVKRDIASHVVELMRKEPETLFIVGPGSTVGSIGEELELDKTLLGIDAVLNGSLTGKDLNERGLLDLLSKHRNANLLRKEAKTHFGINRIQSDHTSRISIIGCGQQRSEATKRMAHI